MMKQELLNKLNLNTSDIVYINCHSNGANIPYIRKGPRLNVAVLKRQAASLITMGYKIEILQPTKEDEVSTQRTVDSDIEQSSVEEVKLDILEETRTGIVETVPEILENINLEEKKEDLVLEEISNENGLEGMSKTKLKKILKEHNIEFENSESVESLKEKVSAII